MPLDPDSSTRRTLELESTTAVRAVPEEFESFTIHRDCGEPPGSQLADPLQSPVGAVAILLGSGRTRIVAAVVVVAVWVGGAVLGAREWTAPRDRPVSVALVQGAVPQTLKWQAGAVERTEDLYLSLTRPHLGADIVVWPEVAIPAVEADLREFLAGLRLEAAMAGSALVIGMLRVDPETGEVLDT